MQARLSRGNPYCVLEYTPVGAVLGGTVVVVGDRALITHRDIAAGKRGGLAAGGAVYEVTADAAIAAGKKVYWDDTANKVTETAAGNAKFGFVAPDSSSADDGDSILVEHEPGKTANDNTVLRSDLTQEVAPYPITVEKLRVWDAPQTNLPGTPATDDLGVIYNTFLTGAPTVESGDSKAATTTRYAFFSFEVPPEYEAGETITFRINAGMKTTVSDTTATVDAQVARQADPTVDICATAAQSINSLTAADKDFTITPTNVVPGDILDVRVAIAIVDGATATAVIGQINKMEMRLDIKG